VLCEAVLCEAVVVCVKVVLECTVSEDLCCRVMWSSVM